MRFEEVYRSSTADIALRRRFIGSTDGFLPVSDQPVNYIMMGRRLKSQSPLIPMSEPRGLRGIDFRSWNYFNFARELSNLANEHWALGMGN